MQRGVDMITAEQASTDDVLDQIALMPQPGRIQVRREGKYDRVVAYDFEHQSRVASISKSGSLVEGLIQQESGAFTEDFDDDIPF